MSFLYQHYLKPFCKENVQYLCCLPWHILATSQFICLFIWKTKLQKKEKARSSICCLTLQMAAMARTSPNWSQEFLLDLLHESKDPSTWAIFHCFFQAISRKMDWKLGILDLKWYPYGMLASWEWLNLMCYNTCVIHGAPNPLKYMAGMVEELNF